MPTAPAGMIVDETLPISVDSAHAGVWRDILSVTLGKTQASLMQVLHANQHQHNAVTLKVTQGLPPRNLSSYLFSCMRISRLLPLGRLYLGFPSFPGLI